MAWKHQKSSKCRSEWKSTCICARPASKRLRDCEAEPVSNGGAFLLGLLLAIKSKGSPAFGVRTGLPRASVAPGDVRGGRRRRTYANRLGSFLPVLLDIRRNCAGQGRVLDDATMTTDHPQKSPTLRSMRASGVRYVLVYCRDHH